ncbi:hypothetical protein, partial [Flagellimonas baculiformis]|uniref:hypothetical protein n=1 Tax=Flagellimonas baculiformis TaxID=3067310 RepID=UPI00296F7DE9
NITGGTDGTDYVITATNPQGCSASSDPFTFDAGAQLPSPPQPIASNQAFCNTDSPTGADLVPAISASITWYSDPGLTSVVNSGDPLATGTYYVTETVGGCESMATSVTLSINISPDIDDLNDLSACNSYMLPAITGIGLTGNQAYFSGPGGTGIKYLTNDLLTVSGTYYIYDETGTTPNCFDEESFTLTITDQPDAGTDGSLTLCEGDAVTAADLFAQL